MSFSIFAIGDKDDIVKALENSDAVKRDGFGKELAELLAKHIGDSTSTHYRYAYCVEAGGHSGHGSPLSVSVTVKAAYNPVTDETADELAVELTTELVAEDGRQAQVLAVIDKCISDLGFAAPETHADRLAQMRGQVEATFDTVVDATIDDDED